MTAEAGAPVSEAATAARALACLDLTDLSDAMTEADADALCDRARTPHGPVAAICLWPRFVARARARLGRGPVRVATVVNFPMGGERVAPVVAETERAAAEGADEIDLVLPYRAFAEGRADAAARLVDAVRAAAQGLTLKVILETGMLREPALIRRACDLAIAEGADFLKTSTGKVEVNATPEAVATMLEAVRASGRAVGVKPSGGVRSLADAAAYLALCDATMGPGWAAPATFRIGASGLLGALLAALDGAGAPPAAASGY